jgi:hypothetical protein
MHISTRSAAIPDLQMTSLNAPKELQSCTSVLQNRVEQLGQATVIEIRCMLQVCCINRAASTLLPATQGLTRAASIRKYYSFCPMRIGAFFRSSMSCFSHRLLHVVIVAQVVFPVSLGVIQGSQALFDCCDESFQKANCGFTVRICLCTLMAQLLSFQLTNLLLKP